MMLFSAITLRVNYSKGVTNQEQYNKHQDDKPDPNYKKETLQPFQTVVFINGQADLATVKTQDYGNGNTETRSINNVNIQHGDAYTLEHHTRVTTRQSGDTLFINLNEPGDITLTCPSLSAIQNNYCNVSISDFKLPRLQIIAGPKAGVNLYNSQITTLIYTGELENDFSLNSGITLDSLKITMGKTGALRMEDITYKVADIKVDSLRELAVYGKAINNIKQIH
ncbi:MAG: hypothetical protein J7623_12015 [Chitinophaga sp.]|uniref:hypothetical protein n=1 Tax=Chitinophaga sp. TaxID=1869181 RepID=UPI001AFFFFC5|nr:hypothetical protein [Chitinophaga sp.]MBO9729354.1 hypothetical protein [Chitinophaga sp.]